MSNSTSKSHLFLTFVLCWQSFLVLSRNINCFNIYALFLFPIISVFLINIRTAIEIRWIFEDNTVSWLMRRLSLEKYLAIIANEMVGRSYQVYNLVSSITHNMHSSIVKELAPVFFCQLKELSLSTINLTKTGITLQTYKPYFNWIYQNYQN